MRHLLSSLAVLATFAAAGQVEVAYPYNPDENQTSSCVPHDSNGDNILGVSDDIGIWDRALTLAEIQGIAMETQPGCGDPAACNYTPDNAEAEVQNCDYCSCVGEFTVGASFSNPIVAHGAQALYTPWGAGTSPVWKEPTSPSSWVAKTSWWP